MICLRDCFSENKLNIDRQIELDIVKGLAIVFMVWCHVFDSFGGDYTTPVGFLVDCVLGGPFAAPVFMVCMGIGICYSRNNAPRFMFRRGLTLLALGYVLNIARYIIPALITYGISGDRAYVDTLVSSFFTIDILQFAGLAFLVLAFVKKVRIPMTGILVFSLLLSIIGTILIDYNTGNLLLDYVLGMFWKTSENAYFTLFHWLAYPVIGCIFGEYMQRCSNKTMMYKWFIRMFLPIGALLEIVAFVLGYGMAGDTVLYFYMNPLNIAAVTALVGAWTGVCYFICKKVKKLRVGYLQKLSNHINNIYGIHWVIIGFVCIIKEFTWKDAVCGIIPATIAAIIILIVSEWIAAWYVAKKKKACGKVVCCK